MNLNIDAANAARRKLLQFNADVIKAAVLVLGSNGFRIEVTVKPGSKWAPPPEIDGIPVVWG